MSPSSLPCLVRSKCSEAQASGALVFADSQLAVISVAGIPFQCRYCPSLAKKPARTATTHELAPKKAFDPFESPAKELLVGSWPLDGDASHALVLNKFPIISNHFILATKASKPQTHLLEPDDLFQTYTCLQEWSAPTPIAPSGARLFAFFNSGAHSGASQPHRHVQFLPVEDMRASSDDTWTLLTDSLRTAPLLQGPDSPLRSLPTLPLAHFCIQLPAQCDRRKLFEVYNTLYKAAAASVRRYRDTSSDLDLHSTREGDLPISYNLAMTTGCMAISPRRREGMMVKRADGSDIDVVALNGTFLGGTLMVKNEELWHTLQDEPDTLRQVLEAIGVPHDESTHVTHADLDDLGFPELQEARVRQNL